MTAARCQTPKTQKGKEAATESESESATLWPKQVGETSWQRLGALVLSKCFYQFEKRLVKFEKC